VTHYTDQVVNGRNDEVTLAQGKVGSSHSSATGLETRINVLSVALDNLSTKPLGILLCMVYEALAPVSVLRTRRGKIIQQIWMESFM
jgi:hypothetical protein